MKEQIWNCDNITVKSADQIKKPMYVGSYQITGKGSEKNILFNFVKKPSRINRFFCRILLGWVWIDNIQYLTELTGKHNLRCQKI